MKAMSSTRKQIDRVPQANPTTQSKTKTDHTTRRAEWGQTITYQHVPNRY